MSLSEWFAAYKWWVAIASLVVFFASIWVLKVLIVRMSADYFMRGKKSAFAESHPAVRVIGVGLKNILGLLLLAISILMLFVPGQGLLTMLFGLSLMDFPGKRALEVRLVRLPKVHRAINWIRRKNSREPLQIP